MQESNKRIVKNTLYLYGRMLVGLVVSLYTSRVILHALGVENFGLYSVIAGVLALFTFINGTLYQATSRFITFEIGKKNIGRAAQVFTNAFTLHFIMGIIIVIMGETIGLYIVNYILDIPTDRLFACNILYQTVIISTFVSVVQMSNGALIIAHERMNYYAIMGLFASFIRLCIAIVIQYIPYDKLISLAILNLLLSLIVAIMQDYYCNKNFNQIFSWKLKLHKKLSKEMGTFSFWQLIGAAAFMLRMQGVTILMNVFFGAAVNAANAIAYQVNSAVNGFVSNITVAANPQITKNYANSKFAEMTSLLFRAGKMSFFLLVIICTPIILETDFILTLWLGDGYPQYASIMTKLVLLIAIVESYTYSIGCAINATGNVKYYQLVICGIMLTIFPIAWVLFKLGLPPYAGLEAYLFTSIVALFSRLYFIKSQLDIPYSEYIHKVFLRTIPILIISIIVPFIISQCMPDGWLRFFIVTFVTELLALSGIYYIGLDSGERYMIVNLIKSKLTRSNYV